MPKFENVWNGGSGCVSDMLRDMAGPKGYKAKGKICKFKGQDRKNKATTVARICDKSWKAEECAKEVNNLLGKDGLPSFCVGSEDGKKAWMCGVDVGDITNCDSAVTRTIYYDKENVHCGPLPPS